MLTVQRDVEELRHGIQRWLGRAVGAIERPEPGFSCETVIVDRELVLRLPPVGDGIFPTYDLEQQRVVQQAAAAAGVPVAEPSRYEPDPDYLGTPFLALPFVRGPITDAFTPADPWLTGLPDDAARAQVWRGFLDALSAIHATPVPAAGLRAGLAAELDWWDDYVAWATDGDPPVALAEALAWCRGHRPVDEPAPSLLWGDVRLGNVIWDPDQRSPRAMLDWDMTSAGPAEMDLAWFLALEQVAADLSGMTVPGFGTRDDAVERLAAALGRPLQPLDWYEVFALVRASAVSTRIALLFERAGEPSLFNAGDDPSLHAAQKRIDASR